MRRFNCEFSDNKVLRTLRRHDEFFEIDNPRLYSITSLKGSLFRLDNIYLECE
jgi:hypothetical protein